MAKTEPAMATLAEPVDLVVEPDQDVLDLPSEFIASNSPEIKSSDNSELLEALPSQDDEVMQPVDKHLQGLDLDHVLLAAETAIETNEPVSLDIFDSVAVDTDDGSSGSDKGSPNDPGNFGPNTFDGTDPAKPAVDDPSEGNHPGAPSLLGSPAPETDIGTLQGEHIFSDPRVATWDEDWPTGPPDDSTPPDGLPPSDDAPADPGDSSSHPADAGIYIGEFEPLDFSPPGELINPGEPAIPIGGDILSRPIVSGDVFVDPRTVNPAPDHAGPGLGDDTAGGELVGEGVVDPVEPGIFDTGPDFSGSLSQLEDDSTMSDSQNDIDDFDRFFS